MRWRWSATRRRSQRPVLIAAIAIAVLGGGLGASVLAVSAGADTRGEPAALARKATLAISQSNAGLSYLAAVKGTPGQIKGTEFTSRKQARTARLGGGDEILAALTGSLMPVAVESNDGDRAVYSSWRQIAKIRHGAKGQGLTQGEAIGVPSVRVYDASTATDRLIQRGAHAPALSTGDVLAFMKGDEDAVRHNQAYVGRIMVGPLAGHTFDAWTPDSGRFIPYAWAGKTLLAYKAMPESQGTDLYAFTGPGESRLLAPGAFVVAVSPDGKRVLVTVGRRMVEVLRVADGAVEAAMALDGATARPDSPTTPHFLMYAGSWLGDRVVANSDVGLVVLNVADEIRIESVFATPSFPHGIVEPSFLDDSHIVGWADLAGKSRKVADRAEPMWDHALVTCDLAAASCVVGEAVPGRTWARWTGNPSR